MAILYMLQSEISGEIYGITKDIYKAMSLKESLEKRGDKIKIINVKDLDAVV